MNDVININNLTINNGINLIELANLIQLKTDKIVCIINNTNIIFFDRDKELNYNFIYIKSEYHKNLELYFFQHNDDIYCLTTFKNAKFFFKHQSSIYTKVDNKRNNKISINYKNDIDEFNIIDLDNQIIPFNKIYKST